MEYIAHADNATKAISQKVFNATKLADYLQIKTNKIEFGMVIA